MKRVDQKFFLQRVGIECKPIRKNQIEAHFIDEEVNN